MELKFLRWISPFRGLPVDDKGASSPLATVTGETVQLYYYNSGVLTADAGQAAGTIVVAKLAYDNIKNALGSAEGVPQDRSLSFTSTALTNEVAKDIEAYDLLDGVAGSERATFITSGMSNGDYCVDYAHGVIYGKKASTQTSLASTTYKVKTTAGTGSAASQIQGNVASLDTDSGNPVKIGLVYNTTPPAPTNGKRVDGQADSAGNLKNAEQYAAQAEDNINAVIAFAKRPLAVSMYSPTEFKNFGANTTLNIKATLGNIYSLYSTNASASVRYLQLHKTATVPAGGAVPQWVIPIPPASAGVPGVAGWSEADFSEMGVHSTIGWAYAISTTAGTFTDSATASEHYILGTYR